MKSLLFGALMFGISLFGILPHVFDNHIQILYTEYKHIMDIGIFLLPDIVIGIGPKNPTSIGPQMLTQCTDCWLNIG